ncbi:MAG: histone deacetylase family protein [Gemmatimonadota bacterium]
MTAPIGFFLHPASPLHDTGWSHPENQGRLRALSKWVGRDLLTLHGKVEMGEAREATREDLLRVHTSRQVQTVKDACARADVQQKIYALDPDTKVSPASWDAAVGSAGVSIAAAEAVDDGRMAAAFVATRPPGHHATPHHSMGFCLFNNVAVTARWLQAQGRARRILIVDWDVHHGNGTQDAFYADGSVFFLSLHQSPHYPGTGAASERGEGEGEGTTLNVPLPAGVSREEYLQHFHRALEDALSRFTPEFVLVSSGFDSMRGDPLGDFPLEAPDLFAMTRTVLEEAAGACGGKVVALLEGGYVPDRVGEGAVAVIRALAGLDPPGGTASPSV